MTEDEKRRRVARGLPPEPRPIAEWRCTATKADGTRCTRYAGSPARLCWQHERLH